VNSVTVPDAAKCKSSRHAALISELQTGVLTYNQDGTNFQFHVLAGSLKPRRSCQSWRKSLSGPRDRRRPRAAGPRTHRKAVEFVERNRRRFEIARAKLERSMVRIQLKWIALSSGDEYDGIYRLDEGRTAIFNHVNPSI
jgi:hypothetical protein